MMPISLFLFHSDDCSVCVKGFFASDWGFQLFSLGMTKKSACDEWHGKGWMEREKQIWWARWDESVIFNRFMVWMKIPFLSLSLSLTHLNMDVICEFLCAKTCMCHDAICQERLCGGITLCFNVIYYRINSTLYVCFFIIIIIIMHENRERDKDDWGAKKSKKKKKKQMKRQEMAIIEMAWGYKFRINCASFSFVSGTHNPSHSFICTSIFLLLLLFRLKAIYGNCPFNCAHVDWCDFERKERERKMRMRNVISSLFESSLRKCCTLWWELECLLIGKILNDFNYF
jgi:hypothetical protein